MRAAVAIWAVVVAGALLLLWLGARMAGGFAYPLDDAYIHLAVARNVASNLTWGVNPGEFASASSSPLWTLLLAASFAVFGPHAWVALGWNVVAAFGVVIAIHRAFGSAATAAAAVLGGLPVVVALGMEHTLHAALALAFAGALRSGSTRRLALLGAALPMIRFEGTFEVAVAFAILVGNREPRRALLLATSAALPLAAFAMFSVANGAWPVPNALLMKGAIGAGFTANVLANAVEGAGAWLVLLAASVLALRDRTALLFVGTALLHLLFASTGWYYRYEAYLLAWGVALIAANLRRCPRLGQLFAVGAALVLGLRLYDAARYFPGRCTYIHDAKIEVARGLSRTAPGVTVALHDIGAMAWVSGVRIVDTAGLGTDAIADLAVRRRLTPEAMAKVARDQGADIGFASESWMKGALPTGWTRVATINWGLDADRRIEPLVIYAITPEGAEFGPQWAAEAVVGMGGRGTVGQGNGTR